MNRTITWRSLLFLLALGPLAVAATEAKTVTIQVTLDRGPDFGQAFGSLFEVASDDGQLMIGAGFQNAYNTRYRADRHAVQFYIRPTSGERPYQMTELPRPSKTLVGSYLFGRDGKVYSTYGGLKKWQPKSSDWAAAESPGGTHETMRLGGGLLTFGASRVRYNGRSILEPPKQGSYQLFFYANGHLCFYHVHRNGKPYRPFKNEADGYSRLYACPWLPDQPRVDLAKAKTLRLPVVGETTFAWGQLGGQVVTGSNIGGFYVFENGRWRMILEPNINVSYQLYSSLAFHDRLLMGQYPTGRVFSYDGKKITDLKGWPPVPKGVSGSSREAQTTTIYGGDLFVGVWPWAELWRYNPDQRRWHFAQRMFKHPAPSANITHPYDFENANDTPRNRWGQRVTSLVPSGPDLFIATSAKAPYQWEPKKFPFLAPDKWKSYGKVYRMTMPGHLAVPTIWTAGPTTLEFELQPGQMSIRQDGKLLATSKLTGPLSRQLAGVKSLKNIQWGKGIYGPFTGRSLKGTTQTQ